MSLQYTNSVTILIYQNIFILGKIYAYFKSYSVIRYLANYCDIIIFHIPFSDCFQYNKDCILNANYTLIDK